jgi:hypothetical protein
MPDRRQDILNSEKVITENNRKQREKETRR